MRNLLAIVLLGFTACTMAPPPSPPVPPPPPPPSDWRATLQANPGFEGARGTVTARSNVSGTGVTISYGEVVGASGTVRPWHIHYGRCGNDQGIVGDANAYSPLRPGANGTAVSSATVNVELRPGNSYFINVHESPARLTTIVACGQLNPM